ncbi:MAG: hypothetical protein JWM11_7913, partial [Planctomycetaceae bacterium]|nr:hypothetical protein [Planctomycetaceae bacterium]
RMRISMIGLGAWVALIGLSVLPTVDAATATAAAANGNVAFGNGRTVQNAQSFALSNAGAGSRVLASSPSNGWCAIAKSTDSQGRWVFGTSVAMGSERDARTSAQQDLIAKGGSIATSRKFWIGAQLLNQF